MAHKNLVFVHFFASVLRRNPSILIFDVLEPSSLSSAFQL